MTKIPPNVREAILAEVQKGKRRNVVAAKFGVSKPSVSRIAIAGGFRHHDRKLLLTPEQADEALAHYAAGESTEAIGRIFGVAGSTIGLTLRRAGVAARSPREASAQLPARHDALDVLTPESSYWCGFLFADGSIQMRRKGKGSPLLSVMLKGSDRGHLVKFRDFLGSAHAIGSRPAKPMVAGGVHGQSTEGCRFTLASPQLAERLIELGRYGPAVDHELAASRDFWRGLADGDGTLCISGGVPIFNLYGEEWLLRSFLDFLGPLARRPGRRPLRVRPTSSIYKVSTSYTTAEMIVELLYADACAALDRKAALAARMLAARDERLSRPDEPLRYRKHAG